MPADELATQGARATGIALTEFARNIACPARKYLFWSVPGYFFKIVGIFMALLHKGG